MRTTQEMKLANPSMRSGGKKEAFARAGASETANTKGVKMYLLIILTLIGLLI
jgi:hypothetical protein